MNIEKLIEAMGEGLGKLVFDKKDECSKRISIEQMSPIDIFKVVFNKLFNEKKYNENEAENLIFDELKESNSPEIYEVALEFYNSLLNKSDEELNKSNFPREEIYQGLDSIQKLKDKE